MPRLNVDSFLADAGHAEKIVRWVREKKAGGFCVFGGTAQSVAQIVKELRSIKDDLLFSCDCEFGLPMRLTEGGTEFPDAMAIAKTGETALARKAGAAIAKEMGALGLGWNFAPVADVNSNPKNPIVNTRSFGETPEVVSEYATAFMSGLQSEGVRATAKHFPGHGDTSVDSHRELPIIERSLEEFQRVELPPFHKLIERGVASVMTGHLSAPELAKAFGASEEEAAYPATLSRALTTSLLREHFGFSGVIVTDSLEMHAITTHFGEREAALLSFEAGTDILLMPNDPDVMFDALFEAVQKGRIAPKAVMERVDRIRTLKEKAYIESSSINPARLDTWNEKHAKLSKEIAGKAVEVLGTVDISDAEIIILADERGTATEKANYFAERLLAKAKTSAIYTPQTWPTRKALND
ncbi:MAG TPA: glycoside hydrolase family 3 N-terminal domain-containing protein, partial [Candidatus Kapabacteria bacterium]